MKTIAAFNQPYDAHMLIARLEGSGIPAYARDEHMVTLDWLASNAIGGVKVDVADEDFERALAVMAAPGNPDDAGSVAAPELKPAPAPARATDFERSFWRGAVLFLCGAVPLGVAFYLITPPPPASRSRRIDEVEAIDSRPLAATFAAFLGGTLAVILTRRGRGKDSTRAS